MVIMRAPERRTDPVQGVKVASIAAGPDGEGSAPSGAPDVVLIHGLAVSNRYLQPALLGLARDHRVFAPDLPGVGRSSRAPRRLSLADLADGVADWMDQVEVHQATVVGHSLGCALAAVLAQRHPARVAGVVLASPAPDPALRPLPRQAWRLLLDAPRERPSMVLLAFGDYLRVGPLWVLRAIEEARREDPAAVFGRVRQPALVISGGRDPLVTAGWAEVLVQALPGAELVTIGQAPHGLPYSAAEPFVAAVRDFVARRITQPMPRSSPAR